MTDSPEYAIYFNWNDLEEKCGKAELLLEFLKQEGLSDNYRLEETACGLVLTLNCKEDIKKYNSIDMKNLVETIGNVNVFKPSPKGLHYKQGVFLQGVPFSIPLEELENALAQQGLPTARIERKQQYVRVEVVEPEHYESLLRNGLKFFNVARFPAIPDRGSRSSVDWHDRRTKLKTDANFVLQCYRCQGWWHRASNCRYKVRCVRCGEHHSVEACPRPRSEPVCCHCSGPHAASNRFCPVRLSLVNAVPISLTFDTETTTPYNPYQHVL